jgi:hypothetical protein
VFLIGTELVPGALDLKHLKNPIRQVSKRRVHENLKT